jgi:hypothetical protein
LEARTQRLACTSVTPHQTNSQHRCTHLARSPPPARATAHPQLHTPRAEHSARLQLSHTRVTASRRDVRVTAHGGSSIGYEPKQLGAGGRCGRGPGARASASAAAGARRLRGVAAAHGERADARRRGAARLPCGERGLGGARGGRRPLDDGGEEEATMDRLSTLSVRSRSLARM